MLYVCGMRQDLGNGVQLNMIKILLKFIKETIKIEYFADTADISAEHKQYCEGSTWLKG